MISGNSNNTGKVDRLSREFFSGGRFRWHKSREEVWDEIESRLGHQRPVRTVEMYHYLMAVAAGILILVGIGSFLRFYSQTIEAPAGIHRIAELPDGSKIELNAVSNVRYYPYRWKANRLVRLDGEAHFEVTPGRKFVVVSEKGRTEVLGTSFNIYARDNDYRVTCLTGKVRVTSTITRKAVLLIPGSKAEIMKNGEISVQEKIDTYPVISWRDNVFLFTAKPVDEVFTEIERQYNITIRSNLNEETRYSGNFTKEQNVEEILGYICPALDSKYIRKSAGLYVITQEIE